MVTESISETYNFGWSYSSKSTATYDGEDKTAEALMMWDSGSNDWYDFQVYTYTYTGGMLGYYLVDYYNNGAGTWTSGIQKWEYTYSGGNKETELYSNSDGAGGWNTYWKTTYSYSGADLTGSLRETWSNPDWINSGRNTYTHNTNGTVNRDVNEYWSSWDEAFIISQRITYGYDVTSIAELSSAAGNVSPNPCNDVLNINGANGATTATIIDVQGRAVASSSFSGNGSVDVSGLAAGTYVVVLDQNRQKSAATIIKQ